MPSGRNRRGTPTLPERASTLVDQLSSGASGEVVQAILPMLANADAIGQILQALISAANRKRPRQSDVAAQLFLLEQALGELRLAANSGDGAARRDVEELGRTLEARLAGQTVAPTTLMLLARAFAEAQLEPPAALRQAMAAALESAPMPAMAPDPRQFLDELAKAAAKLGNDPFALHAEITATGAAFPPEHRAAMAAALAESDFLAGREASIGGFLDRDPVVGKAVGAALAQPGDRPVSSRMVEWLARIRPWLAEPRHPALDSALRALRPRAAPPGPQARPELRIGLASMCDGAGAQSLFAVVRQGRRQTLASVLVKDAQGVADAWVRPGMSKAEAEGMIAEISDAADAAEVSLDFLRGRLADTLATHLETGLPPPFALVQVVETMGLGALPPLRIDPAVLAASLLEESPPARTGPAMRRIAHQVSAAWPARIDTVGSWFEANDAVDALLRPLRGRKQRVEAVLRDILPARRGFWAGRCAWTAATLRESAEGDEGLWASFAFVAQDLAGEVPLAEIPLARRIAETSVDAFVGR